MSNPVPGSGSTESVPTWVSPAQQDAARAASIESVLPQVDGVASVFPPAGADLAGFAPEGVKVNDERVEVHIIAEYGRPLQATADDIDAAVHPLLDGRNLQIVVDDILLPGESLPEPEPEVATEPHPDPAADEVTPTRQKPSAATGTVPGSDRASTPEADTDGEDVVDPAAQATTPAGAGPTPQTGVTVTVAPETATEVTITTDQQGAVQVDVPAVQDEDSDSADERAAGG